MSAKDYPVTLGYKSTASPYGTALRPYHKGIDYGCPAGTPVVVNGVTIGLSGATGFVTGAHLHVGRFVNGTDTNPIGGFKFNNAVVTEIGYDINNGNFVRIQADGASWVYCHLNSTNVTKGQTLKEGIVKPTREQVIHVIQIILGYTPGEAEINAQLGQATLYDVVKSLGDAAQKARDSANKTGTVLAPGKYVVKG